MPNRPTRPSLETVNNVCAIDNDTALSYNFLSLKVFILRVYLHWTSGLITGKASSYKLSKIPRLPNKPASPSFETVNNVCAIDNDTALNYIFVSLKVFILMVYLHWTSGLITGKASSYKLSKIPFTASRPNRVPVATKNN